MEQAVAGTTVHYVEHGEGVPVLVLHGAGVDHREAEACFDPPLDRVGGLRRIYPDLPGLGRTPAPPTLTSAEDVLAVLLDFADEVSTGRPMLVVGHSAGAFYARALAHRRSGRVAGLALVCPLLATVRDVPEHRPLVADPELGDEEFRGYFVIQTPAMLHRYERFVAPATGLVDTEAAARIGRHWQLDDPPGATYDGPTLVVAGRQDSTVGSAAAVQELGALPRATLAVVDGAGHALPHEQPGLLAALLHHWLGCTAVGAVASASSAVGGAVEGS